MKVQITLIRICSVYYLANSFTPITDAVISMKMNNNELDRLIQEST